jgi:L-alanine-DL-glutamate epimerase-like enolase superfamily enzyme
LATIIELAVHDVRFPTAAQGDGSDAINKGDYSATYVELRTDAGLTGTGLTFTNGRGNEVLRVSGSLDGRMVEYVDHLHEHFTDPVTVVAGRYRLPRKPGYSVTLQPESLRRYTFPDGEVWRGDR